METGEITTKCCIAGGGPAGMMLGLLLARAGVDVIVLEKHEDFFRDFRGDTIHPSTIQLMYELGILDEFLKVPHQEIKSFTGVFNGQSVTIADLSHLKVIRPVLGLMPQWDFLNFIRKQASVYKTFHLLMKANVSGLINSNGKVTGVVAETDKGTMSIMADVVVGADGRSSIVREKAGLKVISSGVPIDALWFSISRKDSDPGQILGRFNDGKIMVMLDRDEYWQCAYVIAKGGFEEVKKQGLDKFRKDVAGVATFLAGRENEIKSWDDIKLLSVDIDHLEKWYTDGLICIGDAAHAMSPVGGVGINLAVQDAVAAANMLYNPLLQNQPITPGMLAAIQKRRTLPTVVIQKLQIFLHDKLLRKRMNDKMAKAPFALRLLNVFPVLRRIPAWLIGVGVRPEHIKTPRSEQ